MTLRDRGVSSATSPAVIVIAAMPILGQLKNALLPSH